MDLVPVVVAEVVTVAPDRAADRGGSVGAPVQACKTIREKSDKAATNLVGTLKQLCMFTTTCENGFSKRTLNSFMRGNKLR
jgi:hypothetical protein